MSWRFCLLAFLGFPLAAFAAQAQLELCGTIPLPGVEGRLDHFALDPSAQRLFLAGLGNGSLEIIGIREGRRLQSISGMKQPTGVAYLPQWNWVAVANGGDGTLRIYDAGNYQPKTIIHGLGLADNLRYEPATHLVFAGFGKGGIAIVNAAEAQVTSIVKMPGHPEAFQFDELGRTLFVNLPEAKRIALIDLNTHQIKGSWPMDRFPEVFPMALDEPNHRLFAGCRRPARLVVLDSLAGKVVADLPMAGEVDDLFYDAKRKRVYAACGEGVIEVIEQTDPDHYRLLEKVTTAPGARTAFFSDELDLLAVAVPHRGKQNAEVRIFQPVSAANPPP